MFWFWLRPSFAVRLVIHVAKRPENIFRMLATVLAAFFAALQLGMAPAVAQTLPDKAVEQAIHDYILAHPEVLVESLRRAKESEQERVATLAKSVIQSSQKELFDDPNTPILGNPNGDITIVEFFDYRCPYCRQVEPWLQTLIKTDKGVRLAQKEFPILGPASVFAARMALAAQKQGKHTELHNALMAKKPNIDEATILEVAKQAGLDIDRLKTDMNTPEIDTELRSTAELAKELRLHGTPAFVIGSELVPGATDLNTLRLMVDGARHGIN
jgi:protein-disulfide isomerase